jgi:hypothetical protein
MVFLQLWLAGSLLFCAFWTLFALLLGRPRVHHVRFGAPLAGAPEGARDAAA